MPFGAHPEGFVALSMEKKQETHQASGLSAASVPCLMTLTGIEEWQLRRSRFNHDWLKNRFL
ncbi:MAG: hypothetical protein ACE5ID_10705, partial [Acidobacteriota bacterium]